jgi:Rrf2 family transcriptional regulator, cysteine metabolism repressor
VKVSTKGLYGTLAILDLAIHYSTGHIHKADIAARQEIPEQYLAQLLAVLRRAGYVNSVRGPAGGHTLARRPNEISVGEVIELLDVAGGSDTTQSGTIGRSLVTGILREADAAAARILYDMKFDKLVEHWRSAEGALDFMI